MDYKLVVAGCCSDCSVAYTPDPTGQIGGLGHEPPRSMLLIYIYIYIYIYIKFISPEGSKNKNSTTKHKNKTI